MFVFLFIVANVYWHENVYDAETSDTFFKNKRKFAMKMRVTFSSNSA